MPQILESAPPTPHGAYYTGFCDICRATHVAHSVDGKLWCCKCWVDNGFPPAAWHPGCSEEVERHKKIVLTEFPPHITLEKSAILQKSRSTAIVERANIFDGHPCADCGEPKPWVVWDNYNARGLCADCKADRLKPESDKPLFPI